MIGLYLLAAHMVGDFVLQTRWQAVGKYAPPRMLDSVESFSLRTRHCATYCLPFVPIAIIYAPDLRTAAGFISVLYLLHFVTDRQRFTSTLGDWVAWMLREPEPNPAADLRSGTGHLWDPTEDELRAAMEAPIYLPLEPNPWPGVPIMVDQALHVCQLALLGGLFLS